MEKLRSSSLSIGIFHLIAVVLAAKYIHECPFFGNSYSVVCVSFCGFRFLLGSHAIIKLLIIYYRSTISMIKNASE